MERDRDMGQVYTVLSQIRSEESIFSSDAFDLDRHINDAPRVARVNILLVSI